MLKKVNKKE
jgi:hypothetical protein